MLEHEQLRDLRMYCFESALSIMKDSVPVFTKDKIDELFALANKIYNYINNSGGR